MPTIIDSLLVTFGLKTEGFHDEKRKVQSGLDDLGRSAAKFLAIIGGTYEIKKFIQGQIEANSALERLSRNLNEGVQSISAWSNAAEVAGGSAQGLQGTMDLLSRAQTELRLTGQSGLIPYLAALGVSLASTSGQAKPVSDILLDLSGKFGMMDRTTANNMGRMMGVDQGTMNLLLKGRAEVELYIKRQKEYNAVTEKQAEDAEHLRGILVRTKQGFEALGRTLLEDATPYIEKVLSLFEQFSDWAHEHDSFIEAFLLMMAAGIAAIGVAAIPISPIAVAFLALGSALAAAWDDYQVWKNGGDSLFNWQPGIDATMAAFEKLKAILNEVLERAGHVGAAVMAIFAGKFELALDASKAAIAPLKPTPLGSVSGPQSSLGAPKSNMSAIQVDPSLSPRDQFIAIASAKLGVPKNAIDAQLRLETGASGASTIGDFNYGNIKAGSKYAGKTVVKDVDEYVKGKKVRESAKFRTYTDPQEAAIDYAHMIERRFPSAVGAKNATAFGSGLQMDGYATDPEYTSKISRIAAGIPGASSAAKTGGPSMSGGSTTSNVTIGEITINTQATDAQGIANDLERSLDFLHTSQGNGGLK